MSGRPAYSLVLHQLKSAIAKLSFHFGARSNSGKVKSRRHGGAIVAIGNDGGHEVALECTQDRIA